MRNFISISPTNKLIFLSTLLGLFISYSGSGQTYLSQNFNGVALPSDWSVTDLGTGDCRWGLHAPTTYNGNTLSMLGSNFLYVNSDSAGTGTDANESIASPSFSAPSNSQVLIEFSHHFRATSSALRKDTAFVEVFNGTNWVVAKKYGTTQGTGIVPAKVKLNLSIFANPVMQIRFRYIGNFGYYWCIDNVTVFSPSSTDVGVTGFEAPTSTCGLISPYQVKVKIGNFGSQATSSFPVFYTANNGAPVSEIFSGSILPGDSALYTFSIPYVASGTNPVRFVSWTNATGDSLKLNDTIKTASFSRSPAVLSPLSFSNFTGGNLGTAYPGWGEQAGLNPTGTTSSWRASSNAQTTGQGSTARVNLLGVARKEWLISPSYNPANGSSLSFKLGLTNLGTLQPDSMGSDDSLKIKISTDCGQSWSTLRSYTRADGLTNQLANQVISLSDYNGKNIRIGFYATDGSVDNTNDYDLHITDIEMRVFSDNDASVTQILVPVSECGAPASLPVQIRIFNNGSLTQTSIPVAYSLNNSSPVQETYTGSLAPGASTTFTFSTPAQLTNSGTNLLSAWSLLSGDPNFSNDSVKNVPLVKAPGTFPLLTFTGFDGTNLTTLFPSWKESSGQNPSGTTSSWTQSLATQATSLGSPAAKVNLFTAANREWLISGGVNLGTGYFLRFRTALTNYNAITTDSMGSDDSLVVKVSTDCGTSWNRVAWFTRLSGLTNSFSNQSVSLEAYAGQNIRIAFFGTSGTTDDLNDYDFHLDDIELLIPSPIDVRLSKLILPTSTCGIPTSFPVQVEIGNNGSQTLTSVPLTYELTGQSPVSETFTVNLAPGAIQTLSFAVPVSATTGGNYLISAWSTLATDLNKANDSIRNVSIVRMPEAFPINTFTGFTGANLATVFTGWSEANGANGTVATSSWLNSNNAQTTALGSLSARINLFGNTKRDWIISPPFNPAAGNILKFKVAITNVGTAAIDSMGSDDSVHVMVSTNCGTTWGKAKTLTRSSLISNQFSSQTVSLAPYAGQTLKIAFQASEGTVNDANDYDFHIDDVEITTPTGTDVGVSDIVFPDFSCGTPASFNLKIKVTNYGSQPQAGFPVGYRVNSLNPVSENFVGTLAPGQTSEFTFTSSIDLSQSGTYLVDAWSSLNQDAEVGNDSLQNASFSTTTSSTPTVTFTNYNGTNLSQIFPGWTEKSGQNPTGTTSSWLNIAGGQAFVLGSVTARVWLSGSTVKDWIVSPAVAASANTVVRFRLAITGHSATGSATMGSDDSLNVMVSTNCGQSWNLQRAFTSTSGLSNSLVTYTVNLSGYAGQNVIVGFLATEGSVANTNSFDLHLDDINLTEITGIDPVISETELQVFPNPAASVVSVRLSEGVDIEDVKMVSIDGRVSTLAFVKTDSSTAQFETKDLASGIYTLVISTNGKSVTRRLVLKH